MSTRPRNLSSLIFAGILGLTFGQVMADSPQYRPDIEQLVHRISDRLEQSADQLGLTPAQRKSISEKSQSYLTKYESLRNERKALLQEELQAFSSVLTPEQHEQAKSMIDDRAQEWSEKGRDGSIASFRELNDTFGERLHTAAEKIGLTDEQRTKLRAIEATFATKHQQQRQSRRELIAKEFSEISSILTPEQRQKARQSIEQRVVMVPAAQTLAHRLEVAAEKIGLTDDQRNQIRSKVEEYASQFHTANGERRQLLQDELKSLSSVLTPEQREKVKNYFQDHVVVLDVDLDALEQPEVRQMLKETVSERMEAAADQLGLDDAQKAKIRESAKSFVAKFQAQRQQREALRKQELESIASILTPEQREKVKGWVSDQFEVEN